MAAVLLKKRLLNPGRRKRARKNLSPKQIKYFGTKAQRAALKRRRGNRGSVSKTHRRRKNIGEIITFDLKPRTNSGRTRRKNSMAVRRRRARRSNAPRPWKGIYARAYYKGKKRNPGVRRRRRTVRANTGLVYRRRRRRANTGVVVHRRRRAIRRANSGYTPRRRYSRRRANTGRRYYSRRRRNAGVSSILMKGIGITVGYFSTNYLTNMVAGSVPTLGTGYMSYATGFALAFAQGWIVKKVFKKDDLGDDITIGGVVNVVAKIATNYFPGLSGFRGRGMGLIGASSFTYPQVLAQPGNFAQFQIAPDYANAIAASAAANMPHGMAGIYPNANGGSRNSLRRVGRTN